MSLAFFLSKYKSNPNSTFRVKRKPNSTIKWVEYSADLIVLNEMLKTAQFIDKYKIVQLMDIAERKKKWHYNQDSFDCNRAGTLLQSFIVGK